MASWITTAYKPQHRWNPQTRLPESGSTSRDRIAAMPRKIAIDFNVPDDPQLVDDQQLISRIRNFEEDLEREFSRTGHAVVNVGRIDVTRPRLSIALCSNRHTGTVLIFIEKQLVRHNLGEIASVSKF
jgi:hypothetical protein